MINPVYSHLERAVSEGRRSGNEPLLLGHYFLLWVQVSAFGIWVKDNTFVAWSRLMIGQ